MLHTTYVTPKREFSRYIQRMKHQKENFHTTYNVCNTKKEILPSNYKLQKGKNNKK